MPPGRRGPLADSYPGAVALVVLSLVPFLLLTVAVLPLAPVLARGVGLSPKALDLVVALSDGAYAFGTVLAVQFAVHLRQRRMLLVYVSVFVVASALAAWAPAPAVWAAAFVVQGLCTSLMLIAAVPPLVTGWPPAKMPITGTVMNLCVFGAVAAGPTLGGLEAGAGVWRPLFVGVAVLALLALVFALLTWEDVGPADRDAPVDVIAIGLGAVGCAAAFFGAARLQTAAGGPVGAGALVPLIGGFGLLVALVVYQYLHSRPLMPVRALATTAPTAGILIAMFASAAGVGVMELVLTGLQPVTSPGHAGLLFVAELGAAVVSAGLFGALFRTRFTPVLALSGLALLVAAAAFAMGVTGPGYGGPTVVSAGLVGLGVGASVSPALFIAGFSLRTSQTQRVFAMVELLRGVTAFLVAPVLLFLATTLGASRAAGLRTGLWICLALAAIGGLLALGVWVAGGRGLQVPDLARWQEDDEPAWDSPPLLGRWRGRSGGASGGRASGGDRDRQGSKRRSSASWSGR